MLDFHLAGGRAAFAPGENLAGTLAWTLEAAPRALELRLLWYTEGRGDRDVGVAQRVRVEAPGAVGSRSFEFELPSGPYSCSGRLLSLRWALEAVTEPGADTARAEFVLGPDAREVDFAAPHATAADG